jgi:hypothetical protein
MFVLGRGHRFLARLGQPGAGDAPPRDSFWKLKDRLSHRPFTAWTRALPGQPDLASTFRSESAASPFNPDQLGTIGGEHPRESLLRHGARQRVPITKYCDEHRLTPKQRLELFITRNALCSTATQSGSAPGWLGHCLLLFGKDVSFFHGSPLAERLNHVRIVGKLVQDEVGRGFRQHETSQEAPVFPAPAGRVEASGASPGAARSARTVDGELDRPNEPGS